MLKGIKELVDLLLLWGFMYVGSFLLLIVGIVWIIKTNPTPPTPIIHEHKIVQNIIQPTKRVLVEREVCNRISGCRVVSGTCPDCVMEKIYE
jgi:hypothetical protein